MRSITAFFKASFLAAIGATPLLSGCVMTSYHATIDSNGVQQVETTIKVNGETYFDHARLCGTVYANGSLMRHRSAIFKYTFELDEFPETKILPVSLDGNGYGCTDTIWFPRPVRIAELYAIGKSARTLAEIPGVGQGEGRLIEAMPDNIEFEFNIDGEESGIDAPVDEEEDSIDLDAFLLRKGFQALRGIVLNPRPVTPTARKDLPAAAPESAAPARGTSRASSAI